MVFIMSIFSDFFKPPFLKKTHLWVLGGLISTIATLLIFGVIFLSYYHNRIYQGVYINNVNVGGLTKQEALAKISPPDKDQLDGRLVIKAADIQAEAELSSLLKSWNEEEVVDQALEVGHKKPLIKELKTILQLLASEQELEMAAELNQEQLESVVQKIKAETDEPAIEPSVELKITGNINSLNINPGQNGQELLLEATTREAAEEIKQALSSKRLNFSKNSLEEIQIGTLVITPVIKPIKTELSKLQQEAIKSRITAILGSELTFQADLKSIQDDRYSQARNIDFALNDQKIVSLTDPSGGYSSSAIADLVENWSQKINRPAQSAVFEYDSQSLSVEKFTPPQKGVELNTSQTHDLVAESLKTLEKQAGLVEENPDDSSSNSSQQNNSESETDDSNTIKLPVSQTEPETTLGETNNLGIKTLIGFGDSYYAHSIPARIHNVKITADKLSLSIIPPGEEFSFNKAIGEISTQTGYQPAYVIKNGQTVLGEGGGVCQVSTTLFRALLDAGLKISKRLPHSYRVSYYELDNQPGYDATAYAGEVDLRFINDTNSHILIYSEADSEDLYMKVEIYGTDDGRTTEISNYQKWGYQPPPEPEYIPSTDIPPGQTKQIDWAVSGIKTSFDWTVKDERGEIIREKTFYSNYRPWSAKYLQGVESLPETD